jgi:hypothetical protein
MSTLRRLGLAALLLLVGRPALAANEPKANWEYIVNLKGTPSPVVVSNVSPNRDNQPGYQWAFFTNGDEIVTIRTSDGTPMQSLHLPAYAGAIAKYPSIVPLGGSIYAFVTTLEGHLCRIDVHSPGDVACVDLRRPVGCSPSDKLVATPSVQLAQYSNNNFTVGKDLVFVPTFHGCGDHTQNRVLAINAANLNDLVWTFNANGQFEVDYFSEGCSVDYDRNTIYCGSSLQPGYYQHTLWAINTNNGNVRWSKNAGPIRSRPQLTFGSLNRLYVANYYGALHAYDPKSGTQHWQLPVGGIGATVSQNLSAEFRGVYSGMAFMTDSGGALHAVYDFGNQGFELWAASFPGVQVRSLGSVETLSGSIFVGLSNGTAHQLSLANGDDTAYAVLSKIVGAGNLDVTDPSMHRLAPAQVANKLVALVKEPTQIVAKQVDVPLLGGVVTSVVECNPNAPLLPDGSHPGCDNTFRSPSWCVVGDAGNDCCAIPACHPVSKVCYAKAVTPTSGCKHTSTDGCAGGGLCFAGTCEVQIAPNCQWGPAACSANSAIGCGPGGAKCVKGGMLGFECVNALDGSPDPSTGYTYCGGFGLSNSAPGAGAHPAVASAFGRDCVDGVPVRPFSKYQQPSESTMLTTANPDDKTILTGDYASAVGYHRTNVGCTGLISTYRVDGAAGNGAQTSFYSGVTCNIGQTLCGQSSFGMLNSTTPVQSADIGNPLPANTEPTSIAVAVRGAPTRDKIGCQNGTIRVRLNGVELGTFSTTSACEPVGLGTPCSVCNLLGSVSLDVPQGVPWGSAGNDLDLEWVSGSFRIVSTTITLSGHSGRNYVYVIPPVGGAFTRKAQPQPGYMIGAAPAPLWEATPKHRGLGEVIASFVNRPTSDFADGQPIEFAAIGRTQADDSLVRAIIKNSSPSVTIPMQPTKCAGLGCPFQLPDFNYGPTPPASTREPILPPNATGTAGSGQLFFGNYLHNGDLYKVRADAPGSLQAIPVTAEGVLPWCQVGGSCLSDADCAGGSFCEARLCHTCNRVTAVGVMPSDAPDSQRAIVVATVDRNNKRPTVFFLAQPAPNASDTYVLRAVRVNQGMEGFDYFNGYPYSGVHPSLAAAGMGSIEQITSLSVDPLNGRNSVLFAARENRKAGMCTGLQQHIYEINGVDYSVRPLDDYADVADCGKVVSPLARLNDGFGLKVPSVTTKDDLFVTQDCMQNFEIVVRRSPTAPVAGARIGLTRQLSKP